MIDTTEWDDLKTTMNAAFSTSMHYSITSLTTEGWPTVTPIGSLLLQQPGHALYFEVLSQGLGQRLSQDPRFTILAVNSSKLDWARALWTGTFSRTPAVRLIGRAAPTTRPATDDERARWQRRVKLVWTWKGSRVLWGARHQVRDLYIEQIEQIRTLPIREKAGTEKGEQ